MKTDTNWPNLNYELKTEFIETEEGYKWTMEIHVIGPDDVLKYESPEFRSRKVCAIDLMTRCFKQAQHVVANAV